MDLPSLCIGFFAGALLVAIVGAIVVGMRNRQIRCLQRELQEAELRSTDTRIELEQHLARSAGEFHAQIARLETALQAERRLGSEKLQALADARDELIAVVKEGAGEALTARGAELVKTLRLELNAAQLRGDATLQQRQKAVEEVITPVRETLERLSGTLQRVDDERRRANTELATQLRNAVESQRDLRAETQELGRALKHPNSRGKWGELHLRRLVEVAGMSARCDFTEQPSLDRAGETLRPDLIVHLPGNRHVVIDAKAPLEQTDDPVATARLVRSHARRLGLKNYSAELEGAVDFVVLYLPAEHLFSAALEADPSLIEDAARQSVLVASPTTLLVLLRTVAQAWRGERVAQEAHLIAELGRSLHDQLGQYVGNVDTVGKRLNGLIQAHNTALENLSGVLTTSERIGDLGMAPAAGPETPRLIDRRAREADIATTPASPS